MNHEYTIFYPAENMWSFGIFHDLDEALDYVDNTQLTIMFKDGKVFKMFWPRIRKPGPVIDAYPVYA